jgi:large subunit ribosomal protein L21
MYAVFEDGSRQYRVSEGDVVRLDYRDAEVGTELEFKRVLLCQTEGDVRIGRPLVDGARVVGEVVDHPSVKLYIQHFRRRKNYRRLRGHRQHYTKVRIDLIEAPGMQRPQPEAAAPGETPPSEAPEQE